MLKHSPALASVPSTHSHFPAPPPHSSHSRARLPYAPPPTAPSFTAPPTAHHHDRKLFNAFNLACDPDAAWAGEGSGLAEPAFDSSEEQELAQQLALATTTQHKQQFLAQSLSGAPETKYTPEFLAIRRIQKQVQRQGSQQRQAFYVSLAGALGALLVRQLLKKLRKPGSKPGSTAGVSA